MSEATPVIDVKDLTFSYGRSQVLSGVTFRVEGGAIGLLGPNGAGKSTLLKTLLGFLRPSGGSARVFGMELPRESLGVRQRLGYMPEREINSPRVSAVSFITYCGRLFGMSREDAMERAHEVLNYVGMTENRYRKMDTYSTGMLQRVKFAQALVHDPKLLLLDEPTNGLDPEGRIEMLSLIDELARVRKVTVLLSSHLLPDIEHVCSRVIMMSKGRVVREGSIDELTAARQGVVELRVRDKKAAYIAALEAIGCRCADLQDGMLHVHTPPDTSPTFFFETALAQGTQLRHYRPVRQSLEEVFMAAMGGASNADL